MALRATWKGVLEVAALAYSVALYTAASTRLRNAIGPRGLPLHRPVGCVMFARQD